MSEASLAVQSPSSAAHPSPSDSPAHVTWHPGLQRPGGAAGPPCGTQEQALQPENSWGEGRNDVRQALGFLLLGEAYRAQPDHPDQNLMEAVKVRLPLLCVQYRTLLPTGPKKARYRLEAGGRLRCAHNLCACARACVGGVRVAREYWG